MPPTLNSPHQSPGLLSALRPWTFTASTTPVILGAVLSFRSEGVFRPDLLLITVGAVLSVNGAGNMVNSYFELIRKTRPQPAQPGGVGDVQREDRGESLRRRQLTGEGKDGPAIDTSNADEVDPSKLVNFAAYLYFFGMICLWMLITFSSAKSEFLAGLFFGGLSSSFVYTGGVGLKYYILGDILVMFTFGPLAVLFSFLVQSGTLPLGPLLLALPLAISTEAILHSKHIRDMEADKCANTVSLAVLLGKQGSYFLFTMLLFLPYLIFVIFGTQYSLALGLPVLTMPYAFQLERKLREQGSSRVISVSAAKLNLAMSLLFIIGCLFATDIPFIHVQTPSFLTLIYNSQPR